MKIKAALAFIRYLIRILGRLLKFPNKTFPLVKDKKQATKTNLKKKLFSKKPKLGPVLKFLNNLWVLGTEYE
jgi:hypothetical protein